LKKRVSFAVSVTKDVYWKYLRSTFPPTFTSGKLKHGKKMHVKEIYVIFIHLFDSGILLIIDLNKKKGKRGGG
jgi:hypothetical protein